MGLTLDLSLLVLTVVLTILGTTIGAWLQQRAWRHQRKLSGEEEQLENARQLIDTIVRISDERLYRQRRFLWAIRSGDKDRFTSARSDYIATLFKWNESIGFIKANLLLIYDRWAVNEFEQRIHNQFQGIGSTIERVAGGKLSRAHLSAAESDLDRLGRESYEFVHGLMRQVRERKLPNFADRTLVSFDNRDNLTSIYLIKRLFGVVS